MTDIFLFSEVVWTEVLRPGLRPFRAHKSLSPHIGEKFRSVLSITTYPPTITATLRIYPGISGSSVRAFLSAGNIQGVVLESYGAGNAPRREELLSAFREAAERGVVSTKSLVSRLGELRNLTFRSLSMCRNARREQFRARSTKQVGFLLRALLLSLFGDQYAKEIS